jgi:[histone H3]-lysine36 N-trimethyltransferase
MAIVLARKTDEALRKYRKSLFQPLPSITNAGQLFPHIKHVMQKFTKQLPKDDLKKFAKEVAKKLVASDFKNGRVEDPSKISEKQEKKVKAYVRQFFEKAVEKKKELDKRKKEKEKAKLANGSGSTEKVNGKEAGEAGHVDDDVKGDDIDLTPSSPSPPGAPSSPHASATPSFSESSPELKRKRTGEETPGDESDIKRLKEEDSTPPPPPPPPPAEGMPDSEMDGMQSKEETEEEKELRRQEEDLMRENEEAIKMEQDGSLKAAEEKALHHLHGNGSGVKAEHDAMEGVEDTNGTGMKRERESLMSH